MTNQNPKKPSVETEEKTGDGTRDYGRTEGQATELDAGLPGREPGDTDGGMGEHMGAGEFGNDFGRYGGTRSAPEDTAQSPAEEHALQGDDPEVGRTDSGPRDEYGRPVANGQIDSGEAGGYPQDQRAADDTLGGYGGIAGGVDTRPEHQPGLTEGRPAKQGEVEGKPAPNTPSDVKTNG
jgi:hypothetical protein